MRPGKLVFVALFFGMTLMPGLQMILHPIDLGAIEEKRRLEPPPPIGEILLTGPGRLSTAINRWFDDHVGFRPLMIKLKNQIDYSVFSYSTKVLIGSGGWLYMRSFFDAKIGIERMGEEGQRMMREGVPLLADYLNRRGVKLIVVSSPIRETMVPEHLPIGTPHLPPRDQFQRLRDSLKEQRGWLYIDGQDLLRRPCTPLRAFSLLDIHNTFAGGACFAREVVERIAKAEGHETSPWHHSYNYLHTIGTGGSVAQFLGVVSGPHEVVDYPDRYYGWTVPHEDGEFSAWPGGPEGGIFEWIWQARDPARAKKLPPIVLFGDSFLDFYPWAGFASYFQAACRVRDNGLNLKTTLAQLPPGTKYFVLQFLEVSVLSLPQIRKELP